MLLSDHCDVLYATELNCVFIKWKKYCEGEDYRKPLLHAADILRQHDGCNVVMDIRESMGFSDSDTAWLHEIFSVAAYNSGCRHFFFIRNNSSTDTRWLDDQAALLQRSFSVRCCEGFDDIKLILLSDPMQY